MIDFSTYEQAIGVFFNDKTLLAQAFTHRSYINENPGTAWTHNERLEFLGDAVLELITTDYLYKTYPTHNEGELTAFRSALVNAQIISEVAQENGMNNYLLLSKGEAKDNGKARTFILANTYEAVLGALYLDQGYDTTKAFVEKTLLLRMDEIFRQKLWKDAKSVVQEKAQEHLGVTPSYQVLDASGPDHDKYFTVAIMFGDTQAAIGKGKSKQEAEQKSAREALEKYQWTDI